MKKKIIILGGDPNSINSELIYKSWKKLDSSIKKKIYIVSNYLLLQKQFKKLNYKIKLEKVKDITEYNNSKNLKILDIELIFKDPFNVEKKSASKFVLKSLKYAHNISTKFKIAGLINCAISKNLLNKQKIGVTEYLATKSAIKNNSEVMLIRNEQLSVSPITTHIDIKDISSKLKKELIINKIKTIQLWYKKKLNKKPKIAILGLNPHNAELRKNSEENRVIIPAINKLKKLNIDIKGPFVSDTIFINDHKNYDVIVGMFHDQVLTPFKALYKFNAINITLGLKYLRVSPDHGVAKNLIGKNKANTTSLLKCIKFVNKFGK